MSDELQAKYQDYVRQVQRAQPAAGTSFRSTLDVRVMAAIQSGKVILALKPFRSLEGEHQPGAAVPVDAWPASRVSQLAAAGYLIPADEYDEVMAFNKAKSRLQLVVDPAHSRFIRAQSDLQKAAVEVAAAEAQLAHARAVVRDLSAVLTAAESELQEALSGRLFE